MNGKGTLLLCSAENGDLNGLIHALENGDDVETRDAVSNSRICDFTILLSFFLDWIKKNVSLLSFSQNRTNAEQEGLVCL